MVTMLFWFAIQLSAANRINATLMLLALFAPTNCIERGEVKSKDGLVIRYETCGRGEPAIVFIHGWCCNQTFWEPQRDFFAQRQQVITVDLAGHGRSDTGRMVSTMESFGEDVAAVVKNLKLPRVVLVGHSMGGPVMLEAAAMLKQELVGLVAVDAFLDPDESFTYQQITDYCRPFREDFPKSMKNALLDGQAFFRKETDRQLIDRIVATMTSAPPDIGHSAFLGMLDFANTRQRPLMSATRVPFTCINSKRDAKKVQDGQKYAPQFEVLVLPDSGHFLMMEHPVEFNTLLLQQLKRFETSK